MATEKLLQVSHVEIMWRMAQGKDSEQKRVICKLLLLNIHFFSKEINDFIVGQLVGVELASVASEEVDLLFEMTQTYYVKGTVYVQ